MIPIMMMIFSFFSGAIVMEEERRRRRLCCVGSFYYYYLVLIFLLLNTTTTTAVTNTLVFASSSSQQQQKFPLPWCPPSQRYDVHQFPPRCLDCPLGKISLNPMRLSSIGTKIRSRKKSAVKFSPGLPHNQTCGCWRAGGGGN